MDDFGNDDFSIPIFGDEAYVAGPESQAAYEQADRDFSQWQNFRTSLPRTPGGSSRASRRSDRWRDAKHDRHDPHNPPLGLRPIRYRSGVPQRAPSYHGHMDKFTFHEFERKVEIWVARSEPYISASEQALLLVEALSHGDVGIFLSGRPLAHFYAC